MKMNTLQILFFMNLSHMSCVRITDVKKSFESFTKVNYLHEFVTSVKNSLKLDICEKLVPIQISKLVVRIFHTYKNVTYSCE